MIPIQRGFEDKSGDRLIDVSVKRLKYLGYHKSVFECSKTDGATMFI